MTAAPARRRMTGLSLIELMIALLLSLLVAGGAITVFVSNTQTSRVTEGVARIQENARAAFELMSRDLRGGRTTACRFDNRIENATGATDWWIPDTIGDFVRGYGPSEAFPDSAFGTATGSRIDGTAALQIITAGSPVYYVSAHNQTTRQITLNDANHELSTDDIAVVCDFGPPDVGLASVFQISSATDGSAVISHDVDLGPAGSVYRYGCFEGRTDCSDTRQWPAMVSRLEAVRWYIGQNDRGGQSLFREDPFDGLDPLEIVDNVDSMTLSYLSAGAAAYSATPGDWATTRSVRIELNLSSAPGTAGPGVGLTRRFVQTINVRNT